MRGVRPAGTGDGNAFRRRDGKGRDALHPLRPVRDALSGQGNHHGSIPLQVGRKHGADPDPVIRFEEQQMSNVKSPGARAGTFTKTAIVRTAAAGNSLPRSAWVHWLWLRLAPACLPMSTFRPTCLFEVPAHYQSGQAGPVRGQYRNAGSAKRNLSDQRRQRAFTRWAQFALTWAASQHGSRNLI